MPDQDFCLERDKAGRVVRIEVTSCLNITNRQTFRQMAEEELEKLQWNGGTSGWKFLFDFNRMDGSKIDSVGIGAITGTIRLLTAAGCAVRVLGASGEALKVLKLVAPSVLSDGVVQMT